MEPIPIHCDAAVNTFTIEPALPEGMVIDPTTGTISGRLVNYNNENIVYTVTATTTGRGSTTTAFTFRARSQLEMTTHGAIGCYWKTITECKTPDFDFFYKNAADLCMTVNEMRFTDNDVDNTWPGLDRRFVDYYSAYFYTYVLVLQDATYEFILSSDDGALLFVDDLATPLVARDGCRALGETMATKTLTTGRHLLVVRFFEYNSWSSMYVKFGSPDANIPTTFLTGDYMRVGGRGPTFVKYPFIAGYVNTDLPYSMPQLSSGAPVSWTVSPDLPQGMTIDVNGYISGRPAVTVNNVYTVTATGVNGIAKAEVTIVITDTMKSGWRTKLYEITDHETHSSGMPIVCTYNMLTGNAIRLSQVDIREEINYEESVQDTVWSGFPLGFNTFFYMEYEGYLKMDKTGLWKLRLTCDDGCKLIGADEQLIINHWGCNEYSAVTANYAVSKAGYYYFRVEYQQANGNKGVKLEWQAPDNIWEVVPVEKVFYLPTGVLSYHMEQAHYYQNSAIEENYPVFFSVTSMNNFKIFPELPMGMQLNAQTGRILGTPSTLQIMTKYTVSAEAGGKQYETVIAFDVTVLNAPSGLSYSHSGAAVGTGVTVTLVPLREISPLTIQLPASCTTATCPVSSYTIQPSLPSGLSFNPSTGAITGIPRVSSAATLYTIIASNPAGYTTIPLSLAVSGCRGEGWEGEFIHVWFLSGYGAVNIQTTTGTTQQCSVDTMKADGTAETMQCMSSVQSSGTYPNLVPGRSTFCVNAALFSSSQVKVTCNDNNGCRWQITKDDGTHFPFRYAYSDVGYAPYYDTIPYPTSFTPLTSLTLSKNQITAYPGYEIENIMITANGCYKTLTITPAFGSVTVSEGMPILMGMASGTGSQTYTITATGTSGTASATLSVTYGECSSAAGQRLITFKKTTFQYGTEESWELKRGTASVYSSGALQSDMVYPVTLCLTPDTYSVMLYDSYGDGWVSGGTVTALDENGYLLERWSIPAYSSQTTHKIVEETFVLESLMGDTQWSYLIDGKPHRNWNKIDYDRSAWKVGTHGEMGTWKQNGVYFVHEFTLTDADMYPVVEFGVYYRDGVIVYLNEQEVYRRNMGSGTPSQTTAAASSFDDYLQRIGTAAGHLLRTGKNVLAIEMHRTSTTNGPLFWNAYVKYTAGDCVTRSVGGTIRESNFYDKAGETAAEAWDGRKDTQWTENGLPAWTVYAYDFDHVEWINRVTVTSNRDDATRDPAKFTLYGSNDGVYWDKLYSYERNEMFTARSQSHSYMMMDHMNSYGQYKFEINRSRSGVAQVSVADLYLEACRLVYCPKEGDYPGTNAGTTVTIDCAEGFIGERYRSCSDDRLKPSWLKADESECRSKTPQKGTSYIDVVYAISLIDMNNMQGEGAAAVAAILSSYVNLEPRYVDAWKVKDVTDLFDHDQMKDKTITAVWVRITCSDEQASELLMKVGGSINQLQSDLTTYYTNLFQPATVVAIYREAELSQNKGVGEVSVGLVITLVILILIVVGILSFYIWTRVKNRSRKNGAKKLRATTTKATAKKNNEKTNEKNEKKNRV